VPPALLYHDVVGEGAPQGSGFPGPGAARYKLTRQAFCAHLDALAALPTPGVLTFDDGGCSAFAPVAGLLEERGWRGHFFVATDYLGRPGFLTPAQVRELHKREHVIGTHSCSHPEWMSRCGHGELVGEWRRSREVLSELLGEEVTAGSVPGGFYSRSVARAAAEAGLKVLFTSEPTTRVREVDGCQVVGRYSIYRGTTGARAAALASGRLLPRLGQALSWNLRKLAKAAGGRLYLRLREAALRRAYGG
jgi:peptidoglycan/xylan/chitin deacetylase (PgdA/CDA1 family)